MKHYGHSKHYGASRQVKTHLPCPACGSSDALCTYTDGHWHCFSCRRTGRDSPEGDSQMDKYSVDKPALTLYNIHKMPEGDTYGTVGPQKLEKDLTTVTEIPAPGWRGVDMDTMAFYGVTCRLNGTVPLAYVFPWGGQARKIRRIAEKSFHMEGSSQGADALFGMSKFPMGSASAITVTEGELDAMSAFQMMGSKYPCVSVRSGSSAKADCIKAFKYLDSFEKIYFAFDADEVGQSALKSVSALFDPNKVYVVPISAPYKDANDYLNSGKSKEFVKVWWSSKKHRPKGIVESFDDIRGVLGASDAQPVATYPFPTLQAMTYGVRLGEVNLITAQEKVGKTAFLSALEHHLIKTTDLGVGIIHLEQGQKRSIQGLINYELGVATNLPDAGVSTEDMLNAYTGLVRKEGRVHFYSHFGSDDPDVILDVMRYLVAACGCKVLFLDHITMLVTGFEGDDERRKLDYLSTRMAMLTRELNFTLFLVSHVNDDGKTRGSRNIAKVADLILYLERDNESDNYDIRNTTKITVKGNRDVASSGPAGYLWFDTKSYTIREKSIEDVAVDNETPF